MERSLDRALSGSKWGKKLSNSQLNKLSVALEGQEILFTNVKHAEVFGCSDVNFMFDNVGLPNNSQIPNGIKFVRGKIRNLQKIGEGSFGIIFEIEIEGQIVDIKKTALGGDIYYLREIRKGESDSFVIKVYKGTLRENRGFNALKATKNYELIKSVVDHVLPVNLFNDNGVVLMKNGNVPNRYLIAYNNEDSLGREYFKKHKLEGITNFKNIIQEIYKSILFLSINGISVLDDCSLFSFRNKGKESDLNWFFADTDMVSNYLGIKPCCDLIGDKDNYFIINMAAGDNARIISVSLKEILGIVLGPVSVTKYDKFIDYYLSKFMNKIYSITGEYVRIRTW